MTGPPEPAAQGAPGIAGGPDVWAPSGVRPPVPARESSGWLPTIAVAVIMVGWLIMLAVALAVTPDKNLLPADQPLDVGMGVVVTVPEGWSKAATSAAALPEGVSIQKQGVIVSFLAEEFLGTTEELFQEQRAAIEKDLTLFQAPPPEDVRVAGELPGLQTGFSGNLGGVRLEGQITVATNSDLGVVAIAYSSSGQMSSARDDLTRMITTMRVPQ
jgi:hypothetical protein